MIDFTAKGLGEAKKTKTKNKRTKLSVVLEPLVLDRI